MLAFAENKYLTGFNFQSTSNFGLIVRDGSSIQAQWQKFIQDVEELNSLGGGTVRYKVLFLGRHGEGVHNVAEKRYGTKAWDV